MPAMLIVSKDYIIFDHIRFPFIFSELSIILCHLEYQHKLLWNCVNWRQIILLFGTNSMLQWMGGSRRKVTTSRRSTQKRQRQYFEQRRRQQQFQQQQTAGLESYDEGINIYGQHQREPRSLDVLSLLNLSTTAQEYGSCVANGKEEQEVNASAVKQHTTKDPYRVLAKTGSPSDSEQLYEARVPSDNQIKNVPPQRVLLNASVNITDVSYEHTRKSDTGKAAMDQKLSVLDLLGDDIPNDDSEGHPEHEDHVAFSVEGLGKVGAETPVHSPKQLGRTFGIGFLSPPKAARRKPSKNINYLLDDFEVEVMQDSMMRDIDIPLSGGSLEIPIDIMEYYSNPKKKFSSFRDYGQVDDCHRVMKCSFDDEDLFHDKENGVEDMWGASSSIREENILYGKKTNAPWENWQCQMYSDPADLIDYGKYELSDYPLEGHHQLRKRETKKATEIFNDLDSHAFRHRMLEMDHGFDTFNRARSSIMRPNFNFGNVSSHTTDDLEDDLSLPSEESCSSAAVRDEEMNNLPSDSTARHSRTCNNIFGRPERKYAVKNKFFKELQCKIRDDIPQKNRRSGRCTQTPIPSDNKPVHHSKYPCRENIGPSEKLSFREGHSPFDMDSGFSSLSPIPETKFPSSYSKHWAADALPKIDFDANYTCHRSKCDSSANCSPSCSLNSETFSFCQPFSHIHTSSPTCSEAVFGGPRKADSELEGNPASDSSHENAGSHGATSGLELSTEGHVRKNEDDEFKRQPAKNDKEPGQQGEYGMNTTAVDALSSRGNLPEPKDVEVVTLEPKESRKTSEHSEETSCSLRFHERSPVGKGYVRLS
ncbi:uncharacterized protein LOC120002940 isoform X3 [Tripterygium wilfordii]|uniref:uncharacterized protein LOC120002940 isoform X3 n=1 Tax=Tripterygium wilfordii TaxID=458696 RepID=UPI0018F81C1E|nr:uncharacterized protein LOC120002940 isoform X3 [Tripterygium wilfordii]